MAPAMTPFDTTSKPHFFTKKTQGFQRNLAGQGVSAKANHVVRSSSYGGRCRAESSQSEHRSKRLFDPNSDVPYRGVAARTVDSEIAFKHRSRTIVPVRISVQPVFDHKQELQEDVEPSFILQPETRPISHDQLVAEVKGIYAGLIMAEAKCIEVDKEYHAAASKQDLTERSSLNNQQWQALIALHRTLLQEHHDFFLASQHPSASPALSRLAAKYLMPARMWRHGIHSFLEVLRHRLPGDLDHMLSFIYVAYSMMVLLYEKVPLFQDTWIECLGDLSRYRMAIEDGNLRDREAWSGVARFWYSKAAEQSPDVGRIYHHLTILARPNALQQLSFYVRSLNSANIFEHAHCSTMTVSDSIDKESSTHNPSSSTQVPLIKDHGFLLSDKLRISDEPTAHIQTRSDTCWIRNSPSLNGLTDRQNSPERDSTPSSNYFRTSTLKGYFRKTKLIAHTLIRSQKLPNRYLWKLNLFGFFHFVHATSPEGPESHALSSPSVKSLGSFMSSHLELLFPALCCIFVPVSFIVASRYSRPPVYGCMMGVSSIILLTTADNESMSGLVSAT